MNRHEIPQTWKNYVFEVITKAGMDPSEFTWTVAIGGWAHLHVSRLAHERTSFFFVFDHDGSGTWVPSLWPTLDGSSKITEAELVNWIDQWIKKIVPDVLAPDLWKLAAERERVPTDPDAANTPFTKDERARLVEGVFQLEEFVYQAEPALSVESRQAVAARFSYIRDAIARLKRLDWFSLVVGQLFSMGMEQLITWQTFQGVYSLAGAVLGKLIGLVAGGSKTLPEG